MNIRDAQVHATARELASRRGTSVTDAVGQALAAELQRTPDHRSPAARQARLKAQVALRERCRKLPRRDSRELREIEHELYDENGLPW